MSETLAYPTHDIVNLAAAALSAAPHLTEAERTSRSRTVIGGTMEFQPTEQAQIVLGTLVMSHHLAIMDGFRDIACLALTPAEAARARMVTVSQTKIVLQLLREMRIARKEALTPGAAEAGAPAREPAADAGYEATLAKFRTVYADTLATLEATGTLTPAAAAKAREALGLAVPGSLFDVPGEAEVPAPVTGSRAQRRAMMKRNGGFKRHA